jgi:hypothetical protein
VAPGIPGFGQSWDLGAALKLRYSDPTLSGFPVTPAEGMACTANGLSVGALRAPYARALLVDPASGRSARFTRARECRTAIARLRPRPASA